MLREAIVGTRIGAMALSARERFSLCMAALRGDESLGRHSNDWIARILLERLCADGKTFVDVGAHIGSVISGVSRHSKPRQIIAIEAIPEKADALKKRFPNAIIHCAAAGEEDGQTTFFIDLERSGYSSLDVNLAEHSTVRQINVAVRALDGLIDAADVDVIKIDVEGAELGVLRGAERLVRDNRPTIMFESGSSSMHAYPKDAMFAWMKDHDYQVLLPNRLAHNDDGLDLTGFKEAHLYPARATNFYAVAAERRIEVRDRARRILGR